MLSFIPTVLQLTSLFLSSLLLNLQMPTQSSPTHGRGSPIHGKLTKFRARGFQINYTPCQPIQPLPPLSIPTNYGSQLQSRAAVTQRFSGFNRSTFSLSFLSLLLPFFISFFMSRPPNYEFQEWWNKQREKHADRSLDKSESQRLFTSVEIRAPPADPPVDKDRARSARQLSWVCLLKLQQLAASIAYLSHGFVSILRTANRRIASSSVAVFSSRSESRLYLAIKGFLAVVLVLLLFELVAYFKGWHFSPPSLSSAEVEVLGLVELVYANWLKIRANYLAPPLQSLTNVCIVLFLIQSVDRVVLILGCFWIKFRKVKPVAVMEFSDNLEEQNAGNYPMVLVQIPMCNEREVRRRRFQPLDMNFCFTYLLLHLLLFVLFLIFRNNCAIMRALYKQVLGSKFD